MAKLSLLVVVKYISKVLQHKWYVLLAGIKLNVPIWQLIIHDLSKFNRHEFRPYAIWYFGNLNEQQKQQYKTFFRVATKHHVKNNPHHWQFWEKVFSGNNQLYYQPMPEKYIREMIADWQGASRAYQGSWNMTLWLNENLSKIRVHTNTRLQTLDILENELGYRLRK